MTAAKPRFCDDGARIGVRRCPAQAGRSPDATKRTPFRRAYSRRRAALGGTRTPVRCLQGGACPPSSAAKPRFSGDGARSLAPSRRHWRHSRACKVFTRRRLSAFFRRKTKVLRRWGAFARAVAPPSAALARPQGVYKAAHVRLLPSKNQGFPTMGRVRSRRRAAIGGTRTPTRCL